MPEPPAAPRPSGPLQSPHNSPRRWLWLLLGAVLVHQGLAWVFSAAQRQAEVALELTALGAGPDWPPPAFGWLPPGAKRSFSQAQAAALELSTARKTQLSAALNSLAASAKLVAALDARDGASIAALVSEFKTQRGALRLAGEALGAAEQRFPPAKPFVRSDWIRWWPSGVAALLELRQGPAALSGPAASEALKLKAARAQGFRQRSLDIAADELTRLETQYGPIGSAAELAGLPALPEGYAADKLALARARLQLAGELAVELGNCGAVIEAAIEREAQAAALAGELRSP